MIIGCGNGDKPDVSKIKVDIKLERFDKAFFSIDTNNIPAEIVRLRSEFPHFTDDFIDYILGLGGVKEESEVKENGIRIFHSTYLAVQDSIEKRINNTGKIEENLETALRYVKYYFPRYEIPRIVLYTGPFDAPGVALTREAIAIGLQQHAGPSFFFYNTLQGQELYPAYISRRFDAAYIPTNVVKAIIDDIYPDNSRTLALIDQMIQKGKQLYLLDLILPDTPDSIKTGYTEAQLKWCKSNEGAIWNYILKTADLYSFDPGDIKNILGEAPTTDGMPPIAPGNIGQWVGRQIVRKYIEANPALTPDELMKTEPRSIFNSIKYKPK
ncbi:MAG TPA: hypothetical protein VIK74_10915 [Parasegetibacter sp.]